MGDVRIGLEIHVQITALKTKLFCPCPADYRGKEPNSHVCPVCLGLPGVLPVINRDAVKYAAMVAIALNCKISDRLVFVRKHYFYPDMPKNYQISQYDGVGSTPFCREGFLKLTINSHEKIVRIRRINIEEDPGRITYPTGDIATSPYSLIDYNRAGIALLEIVTEPDIESPQEARAFLTKLINILEHLGVTDTSLEGSFRVDANISLGGGSRVEIKNIGSIKDVERALAYEILRQRTIIERGGIVRRETRHWDPVRKVTITLRAKEVEEDYRYFPDPDLPPVRITSEFIESVRRSMPELPDMRIERFMKQYGLDRYHSTVLVSQKWLADFFEEAAKHYTRYKKLADILITDFLRWVNEYGIKPHELRARPIHIARLLELLDKGLISIKIAKEIMPEIVRSGSDPEKLIRTRGLLRITNRDELQQIVREVMRSNPKAVEDALRNPRAINYIVGLVMKRTQGRADPKLTIELIKNELQRYKAS